MQSTINNEFGGGTVIRKTTARASNRYYGNSMKMEVGRVLHVGFGNEKLLGCYNILAMTQNHKDLSTRWAREVAC